MASDSDEEIVFANSPLHQYLQDAGMCDLSSESLKTGKESIKERTKETSLHDINSLPKKKRALHETFLITYMMSLLGLQMIKNEISQARNFYKQELLKSTLASKVITEEDRDFMESSSNIPTLPKKQQNGSQRILVFVVPCSMAYICSRIMYPGLQWRYVTITDISVVITSLLICIFIIKHLFVSWWAYKLEEAFHRVMDYVHTGERLVTQMRKSLRLIQEAELVARGFTLVNQKSAVSRLEQNSIIQSQRQCPKLRQSLFMVSRKCMILFKTATSSLLNKYPLTEDSDMAYHYLALVPLEDYGPCLQIEEEDPESLTKLSDVTDGFSMSALKGINQLCFLQQSEFFRRLIMTLIVKDNFSEILLDVNSFFTTVSSQLESLQRVHNHHASFIFQKEDKIPHKVDQSFGTEIEDVYVAVHSLDLHLQAALLRVRSLAASLELTIEKQRQSSVEGARADPEESHDALLHLIKQELNACKGCWEEGINRVQKLEKKSHTDSPASSSEDGGTHQGSSSHTDGVRVVKIEDPIIEDQVFEAYIDEEEDIERDYSWDEFLTPEERAKKKQEKAEAMRVLTELKSVIHVRAKEMDRREQIALEKAHGRGDCGDGRVVDRLSRKYEENQSNENDEFRKSVESKTIGEEEESKHYTCRSKSNHTRTKCAIMEKINFDSDEELSDGEFDFMVGRRAVGREESETFPSEVKGSDACDAASTNAVILGEVESLDTETLNEKDESDEDGTPWRFRPSNLDNRLGRLPGANLAFTASLAAQAVAKSHNIGLSQDTFGDSDSEEESQNSDNNLSDDGH